MEGLSDKIGIGCKDFSIDAMIENNKDLIRNALELGVTHINTADFYQAGKSQLFLREVLKDLPRNRFEISLKFGGLLKTDGKLYGIDINSFNIRGHLVQSLNILNLDYIDILIPARIDASYSIEDIIKEMQELVKEGLVRHLGLTMVDADTLRKEHIKYILSTALKWNTIY